MLDNPFRQVENHYGNDYRGKINFNRKQMTTQKNLGIWMDHSIANLIDLNPKKK